ncbi:class F sortase [Microbacterium sp. NPDC055910]|uniref:class F sortase n=1 Tax=Microbacterium sp. NPDC055910 TaxID=3345659 RepID=UPI0035E2F7DE
MSRPIGAVFARGLLAVTAAACLVACTPVGAGDATRSRPPSDDRAVTSSPAPTPAVSVPVRSGALQAPTPHVQPERLVMAGLGVDMPIVPVGIEGNGQMELPVDPAVAGWYRYGPHAASNAGNIVLAAHVDAPDYPIGPLARLRDAGVGEQVDLVAPDGTTRSYVVESVVNYDKTGLPTAELFRRDGDPAVVIITCGGAYDSATGRYRENVVAVAREV